MVYLEILQVDNNKLFKEIRNLFESSLLLTSRATQVTYL